jgi:hypothetical protein
LLNDFNFKGSFNLKNIPSGLNINAEIHNYFENDPQEADKNPSTFSITFDRDSLSDRTESIRISELNLKIARELVNTFLMLTFENTSFFKKIRAIFNNDSIVIKGFINKIIWWPFKTEFRVFVLDNHLQIEIISTSICEFIPIPDFIFSIISKRFKKALDYFNIKMEISDHHKIIKMDLVNIMPENISIPVKSASNNTEFINIC